MRVESRYTERNQRVGRDLGSSLEVQALLGLWLWRLDNLDLSILERGIELVHLARLEVELVERKGDLLGVEPARYTACLEECPRLIGVEQLDRAARRALGIRNGQVDPLRPWAVTLATAVAHVKESL